MAKTDLERAIEVVERRLRLTKAILAESRLETIKSLAAMVVSEDRKILRGLRALSEGEGK